MGQGGTGEQHVLIVEDDDDLREELVEGLIGQGFPTFGCASVEKATLLIRRNPSLNLIIADHWMPGTTGLEFLTETIRELKDERRLYCILISGNLTLATVLDGIRAGIKDFVRKPASLKDIIVAIERGKKRLEEPYGDVDTLWRLSPDLRQIKSALNKLERYVGAADDATPDNRATSEPANRVAKAAKLIRQHKRLQELRNAVFGPRAIDDDAWDILLQLYRANIERETVAISAIAYSCSAPFSTVLRRIHKLKDMNYIEIVEDPADKRRSLASLSAEGMAKLDSIFSSIQ